MPCARLAQLSGAPPYRLHVRLGNGFGPPERLSVLGDVAVDPGVGDPQQRGAAAPLRPGVRARPPRKPPERFAERLLDALAVNARARTTSLRR
jgi:hypothetical protein